MQKFWLQNCRVSKKKEVSGLVYIEIETYELMLAHHSDIAQLLTKQRTSDGNTALHFAAFVDKPKLMALLLAQRADVTATNEKGLSPLAMYLSNFEPNADGTGDKFSDINMQVVSVLLDAEGIVANTVPDGDLTLFMKDNTTRFSQKEV